MRLRYMELPAEVTGELVRTPFVLVLDRCGQDFPLMDELIVDKIGAAGLLVFPGEVQLPGDES